MKIILSELEQHIFPERYPFFNDNFGVCKDFLNQTETITDQSFKNISFFVKLTKLSLSIRNEESRNLCYLLFQKIVKHHYDWNKAYDWQSLKLLLFYFTLFSKADSSKQVRQNFNKSSISQLYKKYQPI